MPESWTAPRTWTNGETITDTMMNTHVRDNLLYLKGVLSGSSLQDVTLANDRALGWKKADATVVGCIKVDTQDYLDIMPADTGKPIRFINRAFNFVMASMDDGGRSWKLDGGAFRTHRHPYANDRHIESGEVTVAGPYSAPNGGSVAVTFSDAFAATPRVTATCRSVSGVNTYNVIGATGSVTTTGCNVFGGVASGGPASNLVIQWIAEGQD